jgi:hypothetical protein
MNHYSILFDHTFDYQIGLGVGSFYGPNLPATFTMLFVV